MNTLQEIYNNNKFVPNTFIDGMAAEWGGDKGWTHSYIEEYEKLFDGIRTEAKCVLEIGVLYGASVRMWEEYFPNATIVGVDIRDICKKYETERIKIHIANAADEVQVAENLSSYKFDVVIDDGSHQLSDQLKTFELLTPYLSKNFIYVIEDIQNFDFDSIAFKSLEDSGLYNVTILDLRNKKGRYDDVLIIITPKKEIFRGTNTKEHWNQKHIVQYEVNKDFDYSKMGETSYIKIANDIIVSNKDSIVNKSILDIGCAVGKAVNYYKMNLPEFECSGVDFSESAIEAAKIKVPNCHFEVRDIILNPIQSNYGVITMLETIEHMEEGTNYRVLDNVLDHCEFAIVSTVDTEDDCFGEHISHYKLDTFEKKGYNVLWKSNLDEIYMPNGVFHYIIFLIKGKL